MKKKIKDKIRSLFSLKRKNNPKKIDEQLKKKMNSLSESAGVAGFSGSGYNAKGGVDHGKNIANKKRR